MECHHIRGCIIGSYLHTLMLLKGHEEVLYFKYKTDRQLTRQSMRCTVNMTGMA